ncbi:unnamed protein product [Linum tenue]|uniref:LysM domain-containing protein n=1 Tax=Linum tenue TaxID=586396 RepID=A0AAV0QQ90_9ROSI|nr:unnamed protein product [Linum tenue]
MDPPRTRRARADAAAWYLSTILLGLILVASIRESYSSLAETEAAAAAATTRGNRLGGRACEEIYVVGEGETLNTISDKCGDPYIVEENPHIHDPDDVFPGLVIKITPFFPRINC